jgi:hypothetical protein
MTTSLGASVFLKLATGWVREGPFLVSPNLYESHYTQIHMCIFIKYLDLLCTNFIVTTTCKLYTCPEVTGYDKK